jgi:carbon storage regulator
VLVLTRKYGEQIIIGDDIVITVLEGRGDSIRIGVEAPGHISVKRAEVYEAVSAENLAAAETGADTADSLRKALGRLGGGIPSRREAPKAPDPAVDPPVPDAGSSTSLLPRTE